MKLLSEKKSFFTLFSVTYLKKRKKAEGNSVEWIKEIYMAYGSNDAGKVFFFFYYCFNVYHNTTAKIRIWKPADGTLFCSGKLEKN